MSTSDREARILCPACSAAIAADSRFCPSCGEPLSSLSQMATGLASPSGAGSGSRSRPPSGYSHSPSAPIGRLAAFSGDAAGFAPGAIVADRYRVIGLLGRGGMGEVYRADDLKLGQPVALKFLPRGLSDDPVRLERFYAEVRIARQVSHPNVCRVYDVGEIGGQQYLSMEYVDGEDLASLLKRIGRLPHDKALEISRQLCAGVAAAHDKGVLHRDLKPANVMIDGRGRARVTDFGLAVAAHENTEGELSGTPAYMAPEQLSGRGASVQSDVYSLGLVLYELFTGRRAFSASTLAELREARSLPPIALTEVTRDVDPAVDRVILRCLEPDPRNRPSSALQISAALPGGDPLAAALAAGETPSPEMVAASGESRALRPAVAWTLLAGSLLALIVGIPLEEKIRIDGLVLLEKPPEVLADRSREILKSIGADAAPADSAHGFIQDVGFERFLAKTDPSSRRWDRIVTGPVTFWYRQSPRPLGVWHFLGGAFYGGVVTSSDPPSDVPGMASIRLNPRGELTHLRVVPPQADETQTGAAGARPRPVNWTPLFSAAGLDQSKWSAASSVWIPRVYADERAAWTGALPQRPAVPVRIEAGAWRGRPVEFEVVGPWTHAARTAPTTSSLANTIAQGIFVVLFFGLLIFGGLLARRNLRVGRGDRRGALRLSVFTFVSLFVAWLIGAHHLASLAEFALFLGFASWALFVAGGLWALYIALEPFVRRRSPQAIVTWTRLLGGDFRDPMVGRDVLVGCAAAAVMFVLQAAVTNVPGWLGHPVPAPDHFDSRTLVGFGASAALILSNVSISVFLGFAFVFMLFALRMVLRSTLAAAAVFALIFGTANLLQSDSRLLAAAGITIFLGITLLVLLRFGLLSSVVLYFAVTVLGAFPITFRGTWYASAGWMSIAVFAALLFYGFRTALGGHSAFGAMSPTD